MPLLYHFLSLFHRADLISVSLDQQKEGVLPLNVKERLLALSLLKKTESSPNFAKKIGLDVHVKSKKIERNLGEKYGNLQTRSSIQV